MSSLFDEENQEEEDIKYYLEMTSINILKVSIPVIITLIFDAVICRFLEKKHGSVILNRTFTQTMNYNSQNQTTKFSIYLAFSMIFSIIFVTSLLLFLYYYGFLKIIFGWMLVSVSLILSNYVIICFGSIPKNLNLPVDYLSIGIILLNLVVIGNISIFWRAPKIFTQAFMIFISIIIAIVFLSMPDWTIWVLLVLLIFYDICVVLCPNGLLNLLIQKSEERNDSIPALVYSTAAYHTSDVEDGDFDSNLFTNSTHPNINDENYQIGTNLDSENLSNVNVESNIPEKPKRKISSQGGVNNIRLGLGDFCFYGILVTRAARLGWDLAILVIFAIILGLSLTLIILAFVRRPLPALPLSLSLGILFFIMGAFVFRPYTLSLRHSLTGF